MTASGRADRILQVAADLVVRLGYRKVTIDDIARQADIGKGTVYLHWRTKQQLFEAVLIRESIAYVEELLDELRKDPATVLPHRLVVASYLIAGRRPVLWALISGEKELLRGLSNTSLRAQELLATERFLDLLTRHGLLRDDIPHPEYTMGAATIGFYLMDNVGPPAADLDLQAKVEALAFVARQAFEPAERPDPQTVSTAAAEIIAVFEDLLPSYRKWIYTYDSTNEDAS